MSGEAAGRYEVRCRDGYYVVVDTHNRDEVVAPDPGHYKRYRDGYLWSNAALSAASDLNERSRVAP